MARVSPSVSEKNGVKSTLVYVPCLMVTYGGALTCKGIAFVIVRVKLDVTDRPVVSETFTVNV